MDRLVHPFRRRTTTSTTAVPTKQASVAKVCSLPPPFQCVLVYMYMYVRVRAGHRHTHTHIHSLCHIPCYYRGNRSWMNVGTLLQKR